MDEEHAMPCHAPLGRHLECHMVWSFSRQSMEERIIGFAHVFILNYFFFF